jgi:hypothetical protein
LASRNARIAMYVGAVLLPPAGMIGAAVLYERGERSTASTILGCAFLGVTIYLIVLGA